MDNGKVPLERAGFVTKGPVFEKTSQKSSSMFEEDVGLNRLGKLPFVVQKSENPVYENTYRIMPDESKIFSPARVKAIANGVLDEMLRDLDYDPKACRELSLNISDLIVRQVTSLGFNRYKIVCLTTIGQKMGQTVRIASQCCWDPKVDNFAESIFVNRSLFALSVVYGLYQE